MNRTKDAIIDAFWLLLEEKPYSKITVKDIVDRCQINRNTFYYHFHDIPDLLETMVKNDADDIIRAYSNIVSPLECVTYFIERCMKRKKAILHVYRSVFREYFLAELERIALYIVTQYMDTVVADRPLLQSDKLLLIRFYKCLFIGIALDWLDAGMEYDLSGYLARIDVLFNGAIEQAYLNSVRST